MRKNEKDITLFSLAGPIMLENFLRMSMGSVNVFMMGKYSDQAVASVGVANQLMGMALMIYSITSMGTAIVVSHYLGAGKKKEAAKVSMVAIALNLFIGILLSLVLCLFSRPIVSTMDLSSDMLADASLFLKIVGGTSFLQALSAAMSSIARSHGEAKLPMYVSIVMNIINLLGNYLVIFRPFDIPLTGVSGVAVSQAIAALVSCVLMTFLLTVKMKINLSFKELIPLPKREMKKIMHIGIPAGMESLSYNLSQIVSTYIITKIGSDALTARIYVNNIVFFVYVFGLSIGQASQILIGHLMGAGKQDEAYRINMKNLKMAVAANFVLSIVVMLLRRPLIGLYTHNVHIINLAATILIFDVFVETGRAFNHIESNSLRGAGDARFCMFVAVVSMWGISVVASYVLGISFGLGLIGIWVAFGADEWFRGLTLLRRWQSKAWAKMTIIRDAQKQA